MFLYPLFSLFESSHIKYLKLICFNWFELSVSVARIHI